MLLICLLISFIKSYQGLYQVYTLIQKKKLKNGQKITVVLIFDFEIELLTFGFTLFEVSHSFSALTPIK